MNRKKSWQTPAGWCWLVAALILGIIQLTRTPAIVVRWETASEQDTAGFYVLRGAQTKGAYHRLNSTLLPGTGSPTQGDRYAFVDADVIPNQTYFYHLEEVTLNGSTHRISQTPFPLRAVRYSWWELALTAVSALFGILMLFSDREK